MATARSDTRVLYYPTKRAVLSREQRLAKGPGLPPSHTRLPAHAIPRLRPPRRPTAAQAVTPGSNSREPPAHHMPPQVATLKAPQVAGPPTARRGQRATGGSGGYPPGKHCEP